MNVFVSIDTIVALLAALGSVPAVLLALAAAPLVRCWLTGALLTIDLAVLAEIVHAVVDPEHRFAGALAARLLASGIQVTFAVWLLHWWRRWTPDDHFAEAAGD